MTEQERINDYFNKLKEGKKPEPPIEVIRNGITFYITQLPKDK